MLRALLLLPAASLALDFFVSPAGSDATGTGTEGNPWGSPFPALPAIAAARQNGALPSDVTVHLASGTYFLPSTLTVTPPFGGDGTHTVSFSGPADPSAPPAVLSGGTPIPSWAPAPGGAGVFTAPLPKGVAFVRQMWDAATGARLLLARGAVGHAHEVGNWGAVLPAGTLTPADVPALAEAELVLWHNWVTSQNKIRAVNVTNSSISVVGEAGDPFFGAGGTFRYALQNVADPGALAPGSFYVAGGALFYKPVGGGDPGAGAVIAEAVPEVVALRGSAAAPVVGVVFANLTIAHAAADLEGACMPSGCGGQSCSEATTAAFHATFATRCALAGVEVVGAGSYAVWFDEGSVDCSITGCWLHDLGMGGVRVGNTENVGSYAAQPTRNVSVSDNTIEDGGKVVPAGTGVLAQESVGTVIVHNHVHHLKYTGVSTGWTWGYAADSSDGHTVGWNHIHDIFEGELSDGGCIYNLGRSPGTLIVNNLCHDVNACAWAGGPPARAMKCPRPPPPPLTTPLPPHLKKRRRLRRVGPLHRRGLQRGYVARQHRLPHQGCGLPPALRHRQCHHKQHLRFPILAVLQQLGGGAVRQHGGAQLAAHGLLEPQTARHARLRLQLLLHLPGQHCAPGRRGGRQRNQDALPNLHRVQPAHPQRAHQHDVWAQPVLERRARQPPAGPRVWDQLLAANVCGVGCVFQGHRRRGCGPNVC